MRNKNGKEVIEETKGLWDVFHIPREEINKRTDEAMKNPPFKKEIEQLLKEVPLSKVNRAKTLWDKWYKEYIKNEELEQIYRAFCSSLKTRHSYWRFKSASLLFLYIYGYVSDEELDLIEKDIDNSGQIFDKHREDLQAVKEINDTFKDATFWSHIPMNISCLAIGASIAFTRAVKVILDVIERLHKNKDYREGHYYGGVIDRDEAILLQGYPYDWLKKGGKEAL
ncbi:MAG: hypothetical protein QMD71_00165 [bacterium]|nr:hypothetical protein [bacterium]